MLFTGFSEHTIDAKQRLAIPAKYRNQWHPQRDGGAWICVPWPTGHLRLYTEAVFARLSETDPGSLTPDDDQAGLESDLYGFAERIEMDGSGRITLPRLHLDLTGLGNEVVVVGAKNRLEVRGRAEWTASMKERFERLPELARKMQARRNGKAD